MDCASHFFVEVIRFEPHRTATVHFLGACRGAAPVETLADCSELASYGRWALPAGAVAAAAGAAAMAIG
jgi:hypothetical protein